MQNLWDACLRRLEQDLPAQQFNTWIRPLVPEAGAGDTLVLAAPNRLGRAPARGRFASVIGRLAGEPGARGVGFRLVLARGAGAPTVNPPTPTARRAAPGAPANPNLERG